MPTAATSGITIGAMMAFAPARVPSSVTSTTEETIVAPMARFCVFTDFAHQQNDDMIGYTCFAQHHTEAGANMMMRPTSARKDPIDS